MGQVDLDSYEKIKFTTERDMVSVFSPKPSARVFGVFSHKDFLPVPFLNPERSVFFIDVYDQDLNLVSRYLMANTV